MSRGQTDETKGWMQIVILVYHYVGGREVGRGSGSGERRGKGRERGEERGGEGRRGGGERGGEGREWVVDKERAAVRREIEGKLWRCR